MKLIQRKTVITVILLILTGFSYSTYAQDIHKAVETGDLATVKKLLEKNPKLALQVDQAKDYPIRAAILNGHTEIAELLITYMDNPDVKDFISKTPLMVAASTGNEKIAALLIAKGAGLNLKTIDGRTPLHYATRQGKEKMAAMLIKKGAKINSQTNKGDTPLRIAIKRHDRRIIDLLLANNAGLKIKDKDDGITLLHKLATLGYHKQVTKLMEQGVDIHSTDGTHRTLLHNAAAGGLDTLLANMIKQGITPNTTGIYGSTPLHEAVYHGHKNTVALLLSKGAHINRTRPDGTTALHIALERGNPEMVELLLQKGAGDKPKEFPELKGDYLGQKKPANVGLIFAPGIISIDGSHDTLIGFFENETLFLYSQFPIGHKIDWTQWPDFLMKKEGGKWTAPYQSKLVGKPWFYNLDTLPEGERIIFAWTKNLDGSGSLSELYLWSSTKTRESWTTPIRFKAPINQGFDTWPSVSDDKTLYYHSHRPGTVGRSDIYVSVPEKGEYKSVKNFGKIINTKDTEHDPYVAPDGSYLLYSSYKPGGYGVDDIYIIYRKADGTWTPPVNLGSTINSKYSENRSYVTPDGKYLFYTSTRTGNLDIYWVDAKIIKKLKPKNLK